MLNGFIIEKRLKNFKIDENFQKKEAGWKNNYKKRRDKLARNYKKKIEKFMYDVIFLLILKLKFQ